MKQSLLTKPITRWIAPAMVVCLFAVTPVLAQDRIISGKVIDEAGVEMPGVNVILKGTAVGTTTNSNGTYTVSIPGSESNPVLVFSFIGYQNIEEAVGQRTSIDISMQAAISELAEVVVV